MLPLSFAEYFVLRDALGKGMRDTGLDDPLGQDDLLRTYGLAKIVIMAAH